MKKLKCYWGGPREPNEHKYVAACFARSAAEAKKVLWADTVLCEECYGEWTEMRVIRRPVYDCLADPNVADGYAVIDDTALCKMGWWRLDGTFSCAGCGQFENTGDHIFCPSCYRCDECGCRDDCPENSKDRGKANAQ